MRVQAKAGSMCGLGLALLLGMVRCAAQTSPPENTAAALHALSRQADVIFAGRVVAVRPAGGTVEIDFAVEDAVRGVNAGAYTLREWAGLWAGGAQPLRVGRRYLMLLHAAGAAGLSAPVGGPDGTIPIRGGGNGLVGTAGLVTDLRWMQARAVRPLQYRSATPPAGLRGPEHSEIMGVTVVEAGAGVAALSDAPTYSSVLEMLRGWEKDKDAAQ
jgi:hypothetical protein